MDNQTALEVVNELIHRRGCGFMCAEIQVNNFTKLVCSYVHDYIREGMSPADISHEY